MDPLAHPVRLEPDGALATVPADSIERVVQDVALLLATRRGERPLVPEFGVTLDVGGRELELADARAQVARWVPEAGPLRITVDRDQHEPWALRVAVGVEES